MKTNNAKRFLRAAGLLAVAVLGGNSLAQAQTLTTLHSFPSNNRDGQNPYPQHLAFDSTGAVYGTTVINANNTGWGTVFQLVPPTIGGGAWKEHVIYDFGGTVASGGTGDGEQPQQGVVFDQNGNLFGATIYGGGGACGPGCGTVYELSPPAQQGGAWKENLLYTFGGRYDGWYPGEVVLGANGSLYGTTQVGGTSGVLHYTCLGNPLRSQIGCGTVFELTPPAQPGGSWTKTILYNFPSYAGDGIGPSYVITLDAKGNLYGTAGGGSHRYGMVFKLTPPASGTGAWTQTVLHNFTGGSDGEYPGAGLVLGPNGVLYGTAANNGFYSTTGIVFQLTPPSGGSGAWTETVLASGPLPSSPLAIDPSGNLYGTTLASGTNNCGIVFKVAPPSGGGAWTETVLHNWPCIGESRVEYHNGLLYGTTVNGGSANQGQVFTLVP